MKAPIPSTIEAALADVIRTQEIGAGTLVRCWHVLRNDNKWNPEIDRFFPCVAISATGQRPGNQPATFSSNVAIIIATLTEDDGDHAQATAIEFAVQAAVDALYMQSRRRAGELLTAFRAAFNEQCAPCVFGGIEIGEPTPPSDSEGVSSTGINITIHYSRSDLS